MGGDWLQWVGCATGVIGSLLLATRSKWSGWGFVSYLTSNACWVTFGLLTRAPGLVVMQVAFTATTILGVWQWLVRPALAARGARGAASGLRPSGYVMPLPTRKGPKDACAGAWYE